VQSVDCEDLPAASVVLSLTGDVISSIASAPSAIALRHADVVPGTVVEIRLVSYRPNEQFRILQTTCATKSWTMEGPVAAGPARSHTIKLRCTKADLCNSYVRVKTDVDWAPQVVIPLKVF
jgi:hypothetical protein